MSTEEAELPEWAEEVAGTFGPVLPDRIQKHLGTLLAAVYAQEDAELSATSRFADLLAKLDLALGDAAERNDAEFKRLLVTILPGLLRFAVSLARDPVVADDLVQDTLVRAWRSRTRFEQGTNFEAWTFTIL
ncbi:sigma factor, partial [Methylobacterium sp. J-070]|uniref:sigma factor n=1 Tax=Methylobacterium sp. J-070 TaxID=2836650 RepID=UPI002443E627